MDGYTVCGSDPMTPGTPPDPGQADCRDDEMSINPGAAEICDGEDNSCDGTVDEGCGCTAGESRECAAGATGVCAPGTQTCDSAGNWSECVGRVVEVPGPDICDGVDPDCDGTIDEEPDCEPTEICVAGDCVPDPNLRPMDPEPEPTEPEPTPNIGGQVAGGGPAWAGCNAGGHAAAPTALMLALMGLMLAIRRRQL